MEVKIPSTAIKAAQLFAAKAKHTPPALHHVQLTMGERGWHLAATDEYHLISLGSHTTEDDLSWTLDLDFLAKELKTTDADVKLILPDDPYEEKGTAQIIHRKGYVRCEVPVHIYTEKRYPGWRKLMPDNATDELRTACVNPDFLLDVCKAAKLIGGDVKATYEEKGRKVHGSDEYKTWYLPFYDIAPDDWLKKDWEAKGLVMPITLFEHQKTALDLLRLNDGFALFMEQGTGKTFPVLFRLAELASNGRISSALIVAPKAVCASWEDKIELLSDEQRACLDGICLVITSYDLLWRRKQFASARYDAVVFDESHYIKTPSAKRTKACLKLAMRAKYRWVLTGTPTSNGQLCNLWSQFAAIDPVKPETGTYPAYPRCLGGDSYYKWIDRVAYLNQWHKPYKYRDVNKMQEIIGEMSYRITKEECLDLPEKMPDDILHVQLTGKVKSHYKRMVADSAIAELDTLASNPLTRGLRLRQMCSGFLDTEGGEHHEFECAKLSALKGFLEDFESKVVIFCDFRRSIDAVSALLDKLGMKHVILDGRQADKGIWRKFQEDASVQAIICQYQSGSAGIDLYAADTCIFFEPTVSSNLNEQAKDRIHRVGQTRACSYIYLLTDGTIEWSIYSALRNYEDFGDALFTQYIEEYTKGAKL